MRRAHPQPGRLLLIRAVARALGDLGRPAVLRVFGRALVAALLLFAAIGAALAWWLRGADPCGAIGLDPCVLDGGASGTGAVLATLVLLWLLFPAVAMGMVAAHGDHIVAAVEVCHYPDRTARLGLARLAWLGLRSAARLLVLNLLALPALVLLIVTGVGPVLLLVAVNGYALGRDAGELVAAGHGTAGAAWLRGSRRARFAAGAGCAALFLMPIANLVAPLLVVAIVVHLFHDRAPG